MKKMILVILVLALALAFFGCASSRSLERGAQGAALGAGVGYLAAKGPGAIAGGLIGGAVGSVVGTIESDRGQTIGGRALVSNGGRLQTPLPWIRGERVAVLTDSNSWGDSIRAVVEEGLRCQGAVIVATPGRRYSNRPEDLASAVYVAEVYSERRGDYAVVQIRIIDRTNDIVRAIGSDKAEIYNSYYYGSGGDYRSFEIAARRAIANLH